MHTNHGLQEFRRAATTAVFVYAAFLAFGVCFADDANDSSETTDPNTSEEIPSAAQSGKEEDGRLLSLVDVKSPKYLEMVFVKGGTYEMGSPLQLGDEGFGLLYVGAWLVTGNQSFVNQGPRHKEAVEAFFFGKYEVTVEQFVFFLNAVGADDERYLFLNGFSPVRFHGGKWHFEDATAKQAANTVTWLGAIEYCKWLSEKTGDSYRLPTEAEWEWAAKGQEERLYPWGITMKELAVTDSEDRIQRADIRRRADWRTTPFNATWKHLSVGSFPEGATPDGICDMVGGVWEWCLDSYSMFYPPAKASNINLAKLPARGTKVLRGGPDNALDYTMTTTRLGQPADGHTDCGIYGFRVLRERNGPGRPISPSARPNNEVPSGPWK